MTIHVYALVDTKVNRIVETIPSVDVEDFRRRLTIAASDPHSVYGAFGEDFSVVELFWIEDSDAAEYPSLGTIPDFCRTTEEV